MRQNLFNNLHTFKNENIELRKIKNDRKSNIEEAAYFSEMKAEIGYMSDHIETIHESMDDHKNVMNNLT